MDDIKVEDSPVASPYLTEIKTEMTKLDAEDYAHATRLLAEEAKRVESGDKYKAVPLIELHHERAASNAVKIRIPSKEFPRVNFSGKLLGPKGSTLKQLQQETGCKLSILGRGSMRDKNKEEELRKQGGKYSHLNDELHLLIECFAEPTDAYNRLAHAIGEIKKFMNPHEENLGLNMGGYPPQQQMGEDQGYFNGEGSMGRGAGGPRGAPAPRGGMPGRGGLLAPPGGRGGMPQRGSLFRPSAPGGRGALAPRGAPAPRGMAPAPRGAAPGMRGAPAARGAPAPRGGQAVRPAMGAAPAGRGAPQGMRAPPPRGAPAGMMSRGSPSAARGRPMAPPPSAQSRAQQVTQQEYDDYGAGAAYEEPVRNLESSSNQYVEQQTYAQETYDDGYGQVQPARRDPYAVEQDMYAEPASAGGDTQFFDYGHGSTTSAYDDYGQQSHQATSEYDRGSLKAPPPTGSRGGRGAVRSHPYDTGRAPMQQSRYGGGGYQ
ncbi:KH domain-containing, RNA-binding, signal transduction-associated protein 2-like isoform X1 [Dreissena polymorpha]|uniref:KH domain-containing, RNA-binding, signal transduction-associated protein 2-like isoform X1 n=1 Tax=Dreissena polymorpha TaxID=45954 RepID=UPI002264DD9B|nr:KH domain-containing, RNA-binding, signal transduction-associated protein 2-like isoform X1 [Dreissena polymorpha]